MQLNQVMLPVFKFLKVVMHFSTFPAKNTLMFCGHVCVIIKLVSSFKTYPDEREDHTSTASEREKGKIEVN